MIESVTLLMSAEGSILRADVAGKIVIKAYLSGMPECKLGVNDKLVMDQESRPQGTTVYDIQASCSLFPPPSPSQFYPTLIFDVLY